jgi:hypothetical protein
LYVYERLCGADGRYDLSIPAQEDGRQPDAASSARMKALRTGK